jgi:hypothetical protein|tara:strand:+ start:810 stop:1418 length:609 start_codon:yes stop_codon:yes gene_type:complete
MSYKIGSKPMGRPSINLKKREIFHAIGVTQSMREAAMYCKVSYNTFKKFAKQYELWSPSNKQGRTGPRIKNKFIHNVLRGEMISNYRETALLKKAIEEGYLAQACSNCKADFTHFLPPTIPPLVLDFLDGNNKNGKVDNLRILCLNCVYELRHYKHQAWYRHRDNPIVEIIDDELEPKLPQDPTAIEEVEFIPFEDFQKTLE